jgi:hypothetical protein
MELPLGAVARALDLSTATQPIWIGWLSLDQLEVIEAATQLERRLGWSFACLMHNCLLLTGAQLAGSVNGVNRFTAAFLRRHCAGADTALVLPGPSSYLRTT